MGVALSFMLWNQEVVVIVSVLRVCPGPASAAATACRQAHLHQRFCGADVQTVWMQHSRFLVIGLGAVVQRNGGGVKLHVVESIWRVQRFGVFCLPRACLSSSNGMTITKKMVV